ncbi:tetratricopeptide repeat protein [Zophobihabitans entericus]|uniref:Uncharacterized protein n=1 Tax=Zophobihabitans entericus TaxID=1635327 RepID=A0A6G9IAW3_9GAMM|nr:tetratricopeptide repeat protein [Zophobihabitans entericus]QIQ21375.1 hypothetical protein IPMB12_06535 [Zophobihabitans entericus]
MPIFGLGLSTIIAICFAVHVIYTGQDKYWLFILLLFPFIGSIVYFIAIVLPSLRYSHSGYQFESKLRKTLDPNKELREAQKAFELSPTIDARLRLASALMDLDKASEALPHFKHVLSGVYRNAPDILLQYAQALFMTGDYFETKKTLDHLRETNPTYRSDDGHLLYARALAQLGEQQAAREEFDALVDYHPSLEVYVRYAEVLIMWGDRSGALKQLEALEHRVKFLPKHAQRLNAEWISMADKLSRQIRTQNN